MVRAGEAHTTLFHQGVTEELWTAERSAEAKRAVSEFLGEPTTEEDREPALRRQRDPDDLDVFSRLIRQPITIPNAWIQVEKYVNDRLTHTMYLAPFAVSYKDVAELLPLVIERAARGSRIEVLSGTHGMRGGRCALDNRPGLVERGFAKEDRKSVNKIRHAAIARGIRLLALSSADRRAFVDMRLRLATHTVAAFCFSSEAVFKLFGSEPNAISALLGTDNLPLPHDFPPELRALWRILLVQGKSSFEV